MAYLQPADYPNYGLPAGTTADWITAATALINSYCRRPDLNVIQYTERLRLTSGAQTVLLSYLPLAPLGTATTPMVSIEGRYAKPRRGELPNEPLQEIALAFSLPGQWTAIDPNSVDYDPNTGELTLPWNVLGLPYNEVAVTYTAGLGDDRRRREDGVRADCAQCAVDAGAERQQDQDRHDADAVFLEFAGGRNSAGLAASLRGEQAGVSDERYGAAQPGGSAADAGRCPAAKRGRNDGPSAGDGHEYGYQPVRGGAGGNDFCRGGGKPGGDAQAAAHLAGEAASRSGSCWFRRPAWSSR
jgi:hypothetical protein